MTSSIVCATRGGDGSRAVQNVAIRLAKESGASLTFLYIVDTSVPPPDEQGLESAIRTELRWMGRTLLRVAERHAQEAGLAPTLALREGQVADELAAFVTETGASLLLIGVARGDGAEGGLDRTRAFADHIQALTGVAVDVVTPESGAGQGSDAH